MVAPKVRRAEFKRARKYRWRQTQRRPVGRLLRDMWNRIHNSLRAAQRAALSETTEEFAWFRQPPEIATSGAPTTLATATAVEPVNYGGSGVARWGAE